MSNPLPAATVETRARAARHIAKAKHALDGAQLPQYGSKEWLALPANHPAYAASILVAAECHRRYYEEELAQRLRAEIWNRQVIGDREDARLIDAAFAALEAPETPMPTMGRVRVPAARANQPMPPRDLWDIGAETRADMRTSGRGAA